MGTAAVAIALKRTFGTGILNQIGAVQKVNDLLGQLLFLR